MRESSVILRIVGGTARSPGLSLCQSCGRLAETTRVLFFRPSKLQLSCGTQHPQTPAFLFPYSITPPTPVRGRRSP